MKTKLEEKEQLRQEEVKLKTALEEDKEDGQAKGGGKKKKSKG